MPVTILNILEKVSEDFGHRFPAAAYSAVMAALDHAIVGMHEEGERGHIPGSALSESFVQVMVDSYGPLAASVAQEWRVETTDDIGEIVYHLVQIKAISTCEEDEQEDFNALFDLSQALVERYPGPCVDVEHLKVAMAV